MKHIEDHPSWGLEISPLRSVLFMMAVTMSLDDFSITH